MDERDEYEASWKDYYAILRTSRDADSATIEAAYAALWQAWSGDGEGETYSDERLALIEEAYQCLSDPASRVAYDKAYMVRRRKGARPLLKRSLSQIMLICPECHSPNLHAFKRSRGKLRCPECGARFLSRVGKLEAITSGRTGFRWYYSASILGLYDGKRQRVDFDLEFKLPCSELAVGDNFALTYRDAEFTLIQNLTTNHYWRLVDVSTVSPQAKAPAGRLAGLIDALLMKARR